VEEGGEEAVALEVGAGERAEVAVADEVGGSGGGQEAGGVEVRERGFEGGVGDVGGGGEDGCDYLLVLFGFQGAGGVE
jgi:hypothetical protein